MSYLVPTIICFRDDNDLGDFRLYDIPDSTFESEEETDESEEGRFKVATSRGVCIMNMVWAVIHRGCMFSKKKEKKNGL